MTRRQFTDALRDLRAHYATLHKRKLGALPDLHADHGTTALVYERSGEERRKALRNSRLWNSSVLIARLLLRMLRARALAATMAPT